MDHQLADICTRLTTDMDGQGTHSCSIYLYADDWSLAPPITSIGLRLSDEMIRVLTLGIYTTEGKKIIIIIFIIGELSMCK